MVEKLQVLSFGAGVQSTSMFLMSVNGYLSKVDHVIFADTGFEPDYVYAVKKGMRLLTITDDMVRQMKKENLITEEEYKAW